MFGGERKENYDDGDSYDCEEYNIDDYSDEYNDDRDFIMMMIMMRRKRVISMIVMSMMMMLITLKGFI